MSQPSRARKEIEAALVAKAQAEPAFRQALLADAKAAVEKELGFHLPASAELRVIEETATTRYLVLPTESDGELSDAELETVAGGTGKTRSSHSDISVNRAKTADKAYTQMDGYIKQ